jgi:hypothetical protein
MKYALPLSILISLIFPLMAAAEVPIKQIARERILSESPEWQARYDEFKPDQDLIKRVKAKIGSDLKVDVYLGLWCPDSRNNVPAFLKALDELGVPVKARYFSAYRKPSQTIKYYVDNLQVERIPTFIFYKGDNEIGRIIENPKAGLLEDMLAIVSK